MGDICRGTILHRLFQTTTPPKPKFFIVIGESETHIVGYFFINSNVNRFVQRNEAFFEMQMPIKRSDYPFLRYDSFVGAHELNMIDKSVLSTELGTGATTIKGRMKLEDVNRLLATARTSDLFSQYEKDTYFKQ